MPDVSQEIILQIENRVLAFIKTFPPGTRFAAAVSGGADSMAMLACLCAIKSLKADEESAVTCNLGGAALCLSCIHVEHGIRAAKESRGDAEHVLSFCEENGIDCHVKHILPGKIENFARRKGAGIEAAARFFRHRAFSRYAARLGENSVILLAHTKDDLLETALMRLLRGAGCGGLAAMPAVSKKNGYVIARPLLQLSRAEIENYLKAKSIAWREDSTNADEKFLRNRIRGRLVPLLNESFPSWKAGISSMAQTQSLAADFIAQEAENRIKWEIFGKVSHRDTEYAKDTEFNASVRKNSEVLLFTDETLFFEQPLIIREEAVFIAINLLASAFSNKKSGASLPDKSIKRKVIREFCEGAINAADLGAYIITREKGRIIVLKAKGNYFERGISRLIK